MMAVNDKKGTYLLGVFFLAMFYRLWVLSQPRDFWHDEAFQYLYSLKPIVFILHGNDVHPPLFNLFTKLLLSIGIHDILILRLIILAISLLFIIFFFYTISEIFNDKIAFISSFFLAASPTFAYYSTEFRNYSLALLFVILQIRYFNRLLKKDKPQDSLLYAFFTALMLYTHFLTGLVLFAQVVYLGITWTKEHRRFIQPLSVAAIFSIPLLFYILEMINNVQSFWFHDINLVSLLSTFNYILIPPISRPIGYFIFFYGILFFALFKFRKQLSNKHLQFILYLFLPIITMWVISQFIPFYHHRYFLFGGMSLFVLVGWGVYMFDKTIKGFNQFALAMAMVLAIFSASFFAASFNTELLDSSMELYNVTNNATDDFITVHHSQFSQSPYRVYFPNHKALLLTNFTEKERFTAGGAVLDKELIYHNLSDILYEYANESIYELNTNPSNNHEIIFNKGGLYVTKIK